MTSNKDREAVFSPHFREDLRYWVSKNRKTALRVFDLIEAIMRDPFQGNWKTGSIEVFGTRYLVTAHNEAG